MKFMNEKSVAIYDSFVDALRVEGCMTNLLHFVLVFNCAVFGDTRVGATS